MPDAHTTYFNAPVAQFNNNALLSDKGLRGQQVTRGSRETARRKAAITSLLVAGWRGISDAASEWLARPRFRQLSVLCLHHLTRLVARQLMLPHKGVVVGLFVPRVGGHHDAHGLSKADRRLPKPVGDLAAKALTQFGREPRMFVVEVGQHPFECELGGLLRAA